MKHAATIECEGTQQVRASRLCIDRVRVCVEEGSRCIQGLYWAVCKVVTRQVALCCDVVLSCIAHEDSLVTAAHGLELLYGCIVLHATI